MKLQLMEEMQHDHDEVDPGSLMEVEYAKLHCLRSIAVNLELLVGVVAAKSEIGSEGMTLIKNAAEEHSVGE